jgi:hypothetical protein
LIPAFYRPGHRLRTRQRSAVPPEVDDHGLSSPTSIDDELDAWDFLE